MQDDGFRNLVGEDGKEADIMNSITNYVQYTDLKLLEKKKKKEEKMVYFNFIMIQLWSC